MVSPRLVAKIEAEEPTLRLAVLIDADNAQAAVIEGLLAEIARFGEATVKRIYGDFTAPTSASWKKVLQQYREFNFEVQFPIKNQAAFRSSSKTT
ncbi:NYN domain-containing protein, partial [Aeromonas caviae]